MNVLIIGAGASRAAGYLSTAMEALGGWEATIRDQCPILAYALQKWVGQSWPRENLETAWTAIDLAWKERTAGPTLGSVADPTEAERQEVWRLAFAAEAAERAEPHYYRTQIPGARSLGWSTEQFLSVAAGWELRRLIQQTFRTDVTDKGRRLYERLLNGLEPQAVISFNYDTILEQCLPEHSWSYGGDRPAGGARRVLKPHGSVNWIYRRTGISAPAEQVQFHVSIPHDEMGYRRAWFEQNLVIGLRDKIEHTALEESPLIRALFQDILTECEEVLSTAENIWVVGYRFAPADKTFLDVVARSLARRQEPPCLSIIGYKDRSELLPHIRYVFGLPADAHVPHCFDGFATWADHGFCNP